jgi:hypothetical protein
MPSDSQNRVGGGITPAARLWPLTRQDDIESLQLSIFFVILYLVFKLDIGGAMGYPTKVQLIKRKQSEQWYINFPAAVAQAMEFERGEIVEWIIEDKESLVLRRQQVPPSAMKKKRLG